MYTPAAFIDTDLSKLDALMAASPLATLSDLAARTSDRFESAIGACWRFEPERADHRRQLRGITGFRFEPTRIELKFKLNQNHPSANRDAVADAPARRDDERSRAVAALMREPAAPEPGHA